MTLLESVWPTFHAVHVYQCPTINIGQAPELIIRIESIIYIKFKQVEFLNYFHIIQSPKSKTYFTQGPLGNQCSALKWFHCIKKKLIKSNQIICLIFYASEFTYTRCCLYPLPYSPSFVAISMTNHCTICFAETLAIEATLSLLLSDGQSVN